MYGHRRNALSGFADCDRYGLCFHICINGIPHHLIIHKVGSGIGAGGNFCGIAGDKLYCIVPPLVLPALISSYSVPVKDKSFAAVGGVTAGSTLLPLRVPLPVSVPAPLMVPLFVIVPSFVTVP